MVALGVHHEPIDKQALKILKAVAQQLELVHVAILFPQTINDFLTSNLLRVRGDIGKLYSLIKCHALLNQRTLPTIEMNGNKIVLVTIPLVFNTIKFVHDILVTMSSDLEYRVRELLNAILKLDKPTQPVDQTIELNEELIVDDIKRGDAGDLITVEDRGKLAIMLKLSERTVYRRLKVLSNKGHLMTVKDGGKSHAYKYKFLHSVKTIIGAYSILNYKSLDNVEFQKNFALQAQIEARNTLSQNSVARQMGCQAIVKPPATTGERSTPPSEDVSLDNGLEGYISMLTTPLAGVSPIIDDPIPPGKVVKRTLNDHEPTPNGEQVDSVDCQAIVKRLSSEEEPTPKTPEKDKTGNAEIEKFEETKEPTKPIKIPKLTAEHIGLIRGLREIVITHGKIPPIEASKILRTRGLSDNYHEWDAVFYHAIDRGEVCEKDGILQIPQTPNDDPPKGEPELKKNYTETQVDLEKIPKYDDLNNGTKSVQAQVTKKPKFLPQEDRLRAIMEYLTVHGITQQETVWEALKEKVYAFKIKFFEEDCSHLIDIGRIIRTKGKLKKV